MAEQKIVQHRRDSYSNYSPSKIKPGEIVMIQSGDPNSSSGRGVYACITAGDVVRLATQDELSTYDQAAQAAADAAEQIKENVVTLKEQVDSQLSSAQAVLQNADDTKTEIDSLKVQIEEQVTAARSAVQSAETTLEGIQSKTEEVDGLLTNAQTAQKIIEEVQEKASEVNDFLINHAHDIDVGSAVTGTNGDVYVYLSDDFKEALGANDNYKVFLEEEGIGKVYVKEKTDTFFIASGSADLAFSWMTII